MDDLDRKLISLFQFDGKASIASIARACGMSESGVKRRVERLEADGVIEFVTVVRPRALGYEVNVMLSIRAQVGYAAGVAQRLSELHEVVWVSLMTGRYPVLAEVVLRDADELFEFLQRRVAEIEGVLEVETTTILKNVKFDYKWKLHDESTVEPPSIPVRTHKTKTVPSR